MISLKKWLLITLCLRKTLKFLLPQQVIFQSYFLEVVIVETQIFLVCMKKEYATYKNSTLVSSLISYCVHHER